MGDRIKRTEDNRRIDEKFFAVPVKRDRDPVRPDPANANEPQNAKKPPTREG